MFDLRYNILYDVVDFFVICESKFDHRNNKKKINFKILEKYNKVKIKHFVLNKEFPKKNNIWENQAYQREFLLENLTFASPDDYILFSDPDEIPNPEILKNFRLEKKNTEYFFKSALIINLTYSINMKPHGKELEYAKKKKI